MSKERNPQHTFVIAEVGVNHNADVDLARKLIDVAVEAGADAVKFQTFKADSLVSRHAQKAAYQKSTTDPQESQAAMIRKLELSEEMHDALIAHAAARGIEFMSTPFDVESARYLIGLGVKRLKVPSGEITNPLLLRALGRSGLPVIVSTGMSTLGEVERALGELASAAISKEGEAKVPWSDALRREEGYGYLREHVTVLHCTTEYPAPLESVNLRAMTTLQRAFSLPVGYSDHTQGITIAIAAVATGASLIEKHFTLDRTLPGPDHKASLEPAELVAMIASIRAVERAMGDGRKLPTPAELPNIAVARKSLVAARAVKKGERWTEESLTVKRPGNGISAVNYDEYLGREASRDYDEDDLVQ